MKIRRFTLGAAAAVTMLLAVPGTALAGTAGNGTAHYPPAPAVGASAARVTQATLPAAGPSESQPPFDFCNTPPGGDTIACFEAAIHFVSRSAFYLTGVALSDTLCDNRAVFATVMIDGSPYTAGEINGLPYTFANFAGCDSVHTVDRAFFSLPSGRIYAVYIRLFASNHFSSSSTVDSLPRLNPYAG